MKLQAYVFCNCFEQGRIKRPPPNAEIVGVLTNGDNRCFHPTPAQYQAYEKWRVNACRHRYGTVAGGELGYRLSREVLHRAMLPHCDAFPIFVRKVLGCRPHTRFSHLNLKQVAKLKVELHRLKQFHLAAGKLEIELRCYCAQLRRLVRAALKYLQPIAM